MYNLKNESKTVTTKKNKLMAIVAMSLCFIIATTFGLVSAFRQQVDSSFKNSVRVEQNKNQELKEQMQNLIPSTFDIDKCKVLMCYHWYQNIVSIL